jgi:Macrocin-O-methyltransferase (TylF)
MTDKWYAETGLQTDRNTPENLAYYENLVRFFREDTSGDLLKLRSFAVYSPRQIISDFLVRYELFDLIRDVQGSIVELGVFNGQGLMSFANISAILEPNNLAREIIGFDTFSGFPGLADDDSKGNPEILKPGGLNVASYERIQRAIALFDQNRFLGHIPKVRLVRGDAVATVAPFLEENKQLLIALLYFDFDIYEPTKFALERLLKRVPKGGVVAFDQLNNRSYPGETAALLDVLDIGEVELKRIPFCSRVSYFVR